ncbi:hypothetical protein LTS18_012226 [Coniosporium uncinatum]|uniref:Uncharacterized protein n=1 Tax=Coniosporium uncinatum TaxID=93489 RepID=A0ACC3DJF1_9PEZI|nr:hypothetical protein LTS18_012226 [Coniosporium uncinatum]
MDSDIADPVSGASIKDTGESGELICRSPFPSMPIFLWGDEGGKKYKETYFERFENIDVWAQHDWTSRNPVTGGFQIHGRSDGVLNPSGIRFGSAEIYAVSEGPAFIDDISETLCVGRKRKGDGDEVVFLFVKMAKGRVFTAELVQRLRTAIRAALSSRHVPKFILEVPEIPATINGKKVEIAVKQIISGRKDIKVSSTVANPRSLDYFYRFVDYEGERQSKL